MSKTAKGKSQPGISSADLEQANEIRGSRPTQEEIEVRAYHIYLERGDDGNQEDDWLQAERELSQDIE